MRGLQTLTDALGESFAKGDVLLKDAPSPLGMQHVLAGARMERRAGILGMTDIMMASAYERGKEACYKAAEWCDSPIEKRLLPWLVFEDYGDRILTIPAQVHQPLQEGSIPPGDIVIIPQFRFAKYRMDFGVVTRLNGAIRIVCVECDGENEHTAEHDHPRDAYLSQWGIPTIRASGKEIYQQPSAVSARVANAVCEQIEGR